MSTDKKVSALDQLGQAFREDLIRKAEASGTDPESLAESFLSMAQSMSEPLHPDLEPYVVDSPLGGKMLSHPLVISLTIWPKQNNEMYEWKRKAVEQAAANKKYGEAVWLHERPYRLDAFLALADGMADAEYWKLLGDIWTDSENIWQNQDSWIEAFASERSDRHMLMTEEEQQVLAELPKVVEVYRGAVLDVNEHGLSWSLDKKIAEWFARRFSSEDAVVITGRVRKSQIVAFFSGRNESEVVVESLDAVEVVTNS